jgi:putative DNA primase/helicase
MGDDPMTTFGIVAPRLRAHGFRPVPILKGTKRPPMKDWPGFVVDDAALKKYRDCGTGLLCGELVGVDIDVLDAQAAAELHQLTRSALGDGPSRIGQPPKLLVALRTAVPFRKRQTRTFTIDGHASKVEVLADGQQFVAYAIHPDTRKPYTWPDGNPLDVPFAALPEVTEAQVAAFLERAEWIFARFGVPEKPDRANGSEPPRDHSPAGDDDPARRAYVESALADETKRVATAGRGSRNHQLNTAALKLGQLVAGGWLDQSRVERSLEDAAHACGLARDDGLKSVRATIRSGLGAGMHEPRDPPERQGTTTGGWRGNGAGASEAPQHGQQKEASSPPTTEDALGLRFAGTHASALRYVAMWSRWFRWDSKRWRPDETLHAYDLVRGLCREARKALPPDASDKLHAILASASTVAAVERLAKSDRRLAATVDQWDRDPDALNTPAGIVDLRTGAVRPHAFGDYLTKITAVAPAPPGTDCPLWRAFLARIMAGDGELIRFLQRVAGYTLTGLTVEHGLFFCYGAGANGKGTYLNTLTGVFASYAAVAAMETFTATNSERHPTDLAMLRGARLVTAQETEEGRRWAEAKIKALTGGDPITARFMRQFFTYIPQFKLLIAGNHKPGLQGVDEAIRRRLNLIPFAVTIPPAERDPLLPEKLKAEWPAILRWAIDGCLEWRRRGLDQPQAVRAATEEYLADEDAFGKWLDECCRRSEFAHETTADLFASWRQYCDRTGEYAGTEKRFRENLKQRDFKPKRQAGTGRTGFEGILLVRRDYTDDTRYGG